MGDRIKKLIGKRSIKSDIHHHSFDSNDETKNKSDDALRQLLLQKNAELHHLSSLLDKKTEKYKELKKTISKPSSSHSISTKETTIPNIDIPQLHSELTRKNSRLLELQEEFDISRKEYQDIIHHLVSQNNNISQQLNDTKLQLLNTNQRVQYICDLIEENSIPIDDLNRNFFSPNNNNTLQPPSSASSSKIIMGVTPSPPSSSSSSLSLLTSSIPRNVIMMRNTPNYNHHHHYNMNTSSSSNRPHNNHNEESVQFTFNIEELEHSSLDLSLNNNDNDNDNDNDDDHPSIIVNTPPPPPHCNNNNNNIQNNTSFASTSMNNDNNDNRNFDYNNDELRCQLTSLQVENNRLRLIIQSLLSLLIIHSSHIISSSSSYHQNIQIVNNPININNYNNDNTNNTNNNNVNDNNDNNNNNDNQYQTMISDFISFLVNNHLPPTTSYSDYYHHHHGGGGSGSEEDDIRRLFNLISHLIPPITHHQSEIANSGRTSDSPPSSSSSSPSLFDNSSLINSSLRNRSSDDDKKGINGMGEEDGFEFLHIKIIQHSHRHHHHHHSHITMKLPIHTSIIDIKNKILMQQIEEGRGRGGGEEVGRVGGVGDILLQINRSPYLLPDNIQLCDISIIRYYQQQNKELCLSQISWDEYLSQLKTMQKIEILVGVILGPATSWNVSISDASDFRIKMSQLFDYSQNRYYPSLSAEILDIYPHPHLHPSSSSSSPPSSLSIPPSIVKNIATTKRINITVYYGGENCSVIAYPHFYISEIIEVACQNFRNIIIVDDHHSHSHSHSHPNPYSHHHHLHFPSHYHLRICGSALYIPNRAIPLMSIVDVDRLIRRNHHYKPLQFVLSLLPPPSPPSSSPPLSLSGSGSIISGGGIISGSSGNITSISHTSVSTRNDNDNNEEEEEDDSLLLSDDDDDDLIFIDDEHITPSTITTTNNNNNSTTNVDGNDNQTIIIKAVHPTTSSSPHSSRNETHYYHHHHQNNNNDNNNTDNEDDDYDEDGDDVDNAHSYTLAQEIFANSKSSSSSRTSNYIHKLRSKVRRLTSSLLPSPSSVLPSLSTSPPSSSSSSSIPLPDDINNKPRSQTIYTSTSTSTSPSTSAPRHSHLYPHHHPHHHYQSGRKKGMTLFNNIEAICYDQPHIHEYGDHDVVSIFEVTHPFEVKIISVDNLTATDATGSSSGGGSGNSGGSDDISNYAFYITAEVCYGGEPLKPPSHNISLSPLPPSSSSSSFSTSASLLLSSSFPLRSAYPKSKSKKVIPLPSSSSSSSSLPSDQSSSSSSSSSSPPLYSLSYHEWIRSKLRVKEIPDGARLCLTLYRITDLPSKSFSSSSPSFPSSIPLPDQYTSIPLGSVNFSLWDFQNNLRTGKYRLKLRMDNKVANPIAICSDHWANPTRDAPSIYLEFPSYPLPVAYPSLQISSFLPLPLHVEGKGEGNEGGEEREERDYDDHPSEEEQEIITKIVMRDALEVMVREEEKEMIWRYREWCRSQLPISLPKLLLTVNWSSREQVKEIYRLLSRWPSIAPVYALQLLDSKYSNRRIREFAVTCLFPLSDHLLYDYLLQLIQILKYENNHYSFLAVWLISRALENQMLVGNALFWMLKSEISDLFGSSLLIAERFALLLEVYLRACGDQRLEFMKQSDVIDRLKYISDSLKQFKLPLRTDELRKLLSSPSSSLPFDFQLPFDPTRRINGVIVEKCKVMDSAKAPLWLCFNNVDILGDPIWVIFKSGDDLRQDILTLQILNIMDKIWKLEGLDLGLTAYRCITTGYQMGMIETILDSVTIASMQRDSLSLDKKCLQAFLQKHNDDPFDYEIAVENFTRSCAGYCVATYILGIGDRHNDNIMIHKNGFLFHIDFGHFLGNYKRFLNVKYERAPFVLTAEFMEVIGYSNFDRFAEMCYVAYNIIRKHANIFINLFSLMLSTGIPELQKPEDIEYLRIALALEMDDNQATLHFKNLIKKSLTALSTQVNFIIHILAHWKN